MSNYHIDFYPKLLNKMTEITFKDCEFETVDWLHNKKTSEHVFVKES